jgi:large subunit ribosomal protein L13
MFGKTHSTKTAEVEKKWLVIDAKDLVVGRLASIVAMRLRGKHKPSFTPHIDDGDNVIVINADKIVLTGRKRDQKVYYHYTGYIGGIKERSAKSILEGKFPSGSSRRPSSACRGPLGKKQLGNLRVCGPDHPHAAQSPTVLDVVKLIPITAGAETNGWTLLLADLAGTSAAPPLKSARPCAELDWYGRAYATGAQERRGACLIVSRSAIINEAL